ETLIDVVEAVAAPSPSPAASTPPSPSMLQVEPVVTDTGEITSEIEAAAAEVAPAEATPAALPDKPVAQASAPIAEATQETTKPATKGRASLGLPPAELVEPAAPPPISVASAVAYALHAPRLLQPESAPEAPAESPKAPDEPAA